MFLFDFGVRNINLKLSESLSTFIQQVIKGAECRVLKLKT